MFGGGTYCIFVPASCTPPVTPPTPTSVPASPCVVKRRVMQISVHDCAFCIGAEIIISHLNGDLAPILLNVCSTSRAGCMSITVTTGQSEAGLTQDHY